MYIDVYYLQYIHYTASKISISNQLRHASSVPTFCIQGCASARVNSDIAMPQVVAEERKGFSRSHENSRWPRYMQEDFDRVNTHDTGKERGELRGNY